MSAKTITIESLLEGKTYRSDSRHLEGVIKSAEKSDVWYGSDFQAYTICVRPTYTVGNTSINRWKDFYATIAVKVSD